MTRYILTKTYRDYDSVDVNAWSFVDASAAAKAAADLAFAFAGEWFTEEARTKNGGWGMFPEEFLFTWELGDEEHTDPDLNRDPKYRYDCFVQLVLQGIEGGGTFFECRQTYNGYGNELGVAVVPVEVY